jgi:WD40 repeat protein
MPHRLRIFVSSPADVPDERLRADLIVDKLSQDYRRFFTIESYRWEHEPMLASGHFQDAIEPPSAFDIVVLILWSRLGTPLPERTKQREYRGIDGRAPVTGTEWEYEEALAVARQKGAPDLLAFRNVSPAPVDTRDPEARARSNAQLDALDGFWRRHFADRGVFLAAYDEYRTLEQFAQRLEQSLRRLIERRAELAAAAEPRAPIWPGDPFRGLEPYEFEHAPIFFGRDAAVMKAIEQLAANYRAGRAFLLVSGASGSGKSSLVKAGIVPRLMKPQRISGLSFLRRAVFRPGAQGGGDVILGLVLALTRASEDKRVGLRELISEGQDAAKLAAHLRGAAAEPGYLFANALGRLTEEGRRSGRLLAFEEARLILVVDQLEELFTVPGIGQEDRLLFVRLLAGLARSGSVWVIATLRADFWHRAAELPELVALAEGQGRIDLAAPSPAELAEMIRKPAEAAGLSFETHPQSGLPLDSLLAEHAAAAPGALPLLSFALDELHRGAKARALSVLTHASYEVLGGLEGAIANRADKILAGLPAAAQAALPRVLRALTTVGGAADGTSVARVAPLASFAEGSPARILVDAFTAARLLVAASEGGAAATVRLAHEALIRSWQRARDQLAADRRDLETRALAERQFGRWIKTQGRARGPMLLRNPDLANAVDLARRWGDELDAPLRDFITKSSNHARLAQTLTAAAAIIFALVAGAAFYAERQAVRATMEADAQAQQALLARNEAERRQVNLTAEVAASERLRGNLDTALRLGVRAARLALVLGKGEVGTTLPRSALTAAVWQAKWRLMLSGHDGEVRSAAFSPNGRRVVTASADGTARIFDATSGKQIQLLRGHNDLVNSAAFSPDGRFVVTASNDKTVRIWDAMTGKEITVLHGHEKEVNSAAFSPDGTRVVTASNDKTARIWDTTSGEQIAVLRGHEDTVNFAEFSPDGARIVTASGSALLTLSAAGAFSDMTARTWDAATGKQLVIMRGHGDILYSARFSPDGKRVVTASADSTARIFEADTGREIRALRGHENWVKSAAFSPDGTRVVTASGDKTARLFDAATGKLIMVLRHEDRVNSAAFSPDGSAIVTASGDRTARIWNAKANDAIELGGEVSYVATYSFGGKEIIGASSSKIAHVFDAATGAVTAALEGHSESVWFATFSPDGKRVVTASTDKTARVFDPATGKAISVLRGHEDAVRSAAFTPDGRLVATASRDKTARIFEADTGREIATLRGHESWVNSAVFSPDGKRVLTASADKTARIFDALTGKEIAVLRGHDVQSPPRRSAPTAGAS